MNHIILLTHGQMCKGVMDSCQLILGRIQEFQTLSITLEQDINDIHKQLQNIISSYSDHKPVIIVTDIAGGSTTQTAIRLLEEKDNIYVIAGMSLGLVMSLVFCDLSGNDDQIRNNIYQAIEESKSGIYLVNDMMTNDDTMADDDEL